MPAQGQYKFDKWALDCMCLSRHTDRQIPAYAPIRPAYPGRTAPSGAARYRPTDRAPFA